MRVFIAMPVPEPVKAALLELQSELSALVSGPGLRWVKPEQFHLTLSFLGEVDPSRCEDLLAAARAGCRGYAPFKVKAAQAGFFPNEHRPRVLWAGLHTPGQELAALQRSVASATGLFAERPEEHPFSPHLTLARIKSIRPSEARALAESLHGMSNRLLGEWTADAVEVMRSELHPSGSRYTCLARLLLA